MSHLVHALIAAVVGIFWAVGVSLNDAPTWGSYAVFAVVFNTAFYAMQYGRSGT